MADPTLKLLLLGEDRGAGKALKDVGNDAERTDRKTADLGSGLGELGEKMSGIMTKAGAVGPAVMAVGAAMSAAAAGGTALIGAVGPAAVAGLAAYAGTLLAVKSAAAVTTFALDGIAEAASGDEKALAKLTPEGRKLATTLGDLQPEVEGLRRNLQAGMFDDFSEGTTRLARAYLPELNVAARQTGTVIGDLADEGSRMAASGPWQRDFGTVSAANAKNIGLMGESGLFLADAARSLITTGMPLATTFLTWARGASENVNAFVQAKRESGELAAFWQTAADRGATLGRILGNIATGLFNVFSIGGSGQGASMLTNLEGMTAQFEAWTESEGGRKAISEWFATGRENLSAMGGLLGDVTKGLAGMGSGKQLAPLINQIRDEVLPPLMTFLENASASGALEALVSAIGSVLGVLGRLSEHDGSLRAFADTLKVVADGAGWVIDNVPGAGDALGAFFMIAGGSAALKFVGLGGVVSGLGNLVVVMGTKFGVAAGLISAETGALTVNTFAKKISTSTAGTWIGVKAIEFAAWVRTTAATVASAGATLAATAASKVARGAVLAWTAVQWLLNAALTANPIGLVVAAIALLVLGFVIAYKKSETFRKIVQGGLKAIASAFTWMWNNVARPVLLALGKAFGVVMATWATLLRALSKIPGFGWAGRAADAMQGAANKAMNLGDSIKRIPNKQVSVGANVYGKSGVDGLFYSVDRLRNKTVVITAATQYTGQTRSVMGAHTARAVGGAAQGRVLVGERGPEIVNLPRGSDVVPAEQSRRMMQGSGSSEADYVLVEVVVKGEDGRVIERKLSKRKREKGTRLEFES